MVNLSNAQRLSDIENEVKQYANTLSTHTEILEKLQSEIQKKSEALDNSILQKSIVLSEERYNQLKAEQTDAIKQMQTEQRNAFNIIESSINGMTEKITNCVSEIQEINKQTVDDLQVAGNKTIEELQKPVEFAIQKFSAQYRLDTDSLSSIVSDIKKAGDSVFVKIIQDLNTAQNNFETSLQETVKKSTALFKQLYNGRKVIDILVIISSIMSFILFALGIYFLLRR